MAQPMARFRAGGVSAAIWENEAVVQGKQLRILKAQVTRRYKDRSGEWRSSESFSRNEIPLAIYCLQKAFEAIIEKDNERVENGRVDEEVVT